MDKQRGIPTFLAEERGATAVEYGLIVSLIVLAMITGMSTFANTTVNMWNGIANVVSSGNER